VPTAPSNVGFSNRPFGVKHFQTSTTAVSMSFAGYQVGVDATVAALAYIANHAVNSDFVDVTLGQLGIHFRIWFKLFHVASPLDYRSHSRAVKQLMERFDAPLVRRVWGIRNDGLEVQVSVRC
jgi:hypothetical protein